jgi:hypothetical protein
MRQIRRQWIVADGVSEVQQGWPSVFPGDPPALFWEGVPRRSTVAVGVGGAQERLDGIAVSAAHN